MPLLILSLSSATTFPHSTFPVNFPLAKEGIEAILFVHSNEKISASNSSFVRVIKVYGETYKLVHRMEHLDSASTTRVVIILWMDGSLCAHF